MVDEGVELSSVGVGVGLRGCEAYFEDDGRAVEVQDGESPARCLAFCPDAAAVCAEGAGGSVEQADGEGYFEVGGVVGYDHLGAVGGSLCRGVEVEVDAYDVGGKGRGIVDLLA